MNEESRDEIAASVAAHAELGPRYDGAVAEGLVERIGEEIDRRVEARLRGLGASGGQDPYVAQNSHGGQSALERPAGPQQYYAPVPAVPAPAAPVPAAQHRSNGVAGVVLSLGSIALGTGVTTAVVSDAAASVAKVLIVLLIWIAIAVVNVAHARRR